MSDSPQHRSLYLDPGADYTVRFECTRCEGFRWRAVNPGRNVRRALDALDRGDTDHARQKLKDALRDLAHFAKWEDDHAI